MRCVSAWGTGLVLTAKKGLEARERDDGGFIVLSPSLATGGADVLLVVLDFDPGPQPAACA